MSIKVFIRRCLIEADLFRFAMFNGVSYRQALESCGYDYEKGLIHE